MKTYNFYEKIEKMLIRFIVKNFKSFKDETEFNMLPTKGKGYQNHNNHIFESASGVRVLKTAAIYGANASGKSNLTDALLHFKGIALNNSSRIPLMPLSQRFKIDKSYKTKPTSFRIEYLFENKTDSIVYQKVFMQILFEPELYYSEQLSENIERNLALVDQLTLQISQSMDENQWQHFHEQVREWRVLAEDMME